MKRYVAVAALMTALAGPASAQMMTAPMMLPTNSEAFRMMAIQSDAFEQVSSSMALERSRDPRIRAYAREMINDHSRTTAALVPPGYTVGRDGRVVAAGTATGAVGGAVVGAAVGGPVGAAVGAGVGAAAGAASGAAAAGGTAGPGAVPIVDPRKITMLNQLSAATGPEFDALYAQMQVMSHQEAVAMFQAYAQGGDNPNMRAFAAQALPDLQDHLAKAQTLTGRMRG